MTPGGRRVGRRWIVSCTALLVTAIACVDLSVDPKAIESIDFPPLPNASILFDATLRDTLRDTTGKAYALVARVYDAAGDEVATAVPAFVAADTLVTVTESNGKKYVVVVKSVAGTGRLTATIGGALQSVVRTIDVVQAPETASYTGVAQDTIRFATIPVPADTSEALGVKLSLKAGAGVKSIVVSYSVEHNGVTTPAVTDTTQQLSLIDPSGRGSSVDTTDDPGIVARRLRYRVPAGGGKVDSVTVIASARGLLGKPVPGSPLRFKVVLQPR